MKKQKTDGIKLSETVLTTTVIVAALGYFVDIYDLVLFTIVRVPSLKDIGLRGEQLLDQGVLLLNMQMAGMLVGGIFWGIMGDRRGRLAVLFGSILAYSLANIANAFVHSIEMYAVLRFIAGIGLAGELGAGITLVSETISKEKRGLATAMVAGVGVAGAVLAGFVAQTFDWRTAYVVGGVMGLLLLFLRVKMFESGMFWQITEKSEYANVSRGNFFGLISKKHLIGRYLHCILVGVPLWFVVGIIITFSPEICKLLGATEAVDAGKGIMFNYGGLIVGDFASGFLSQVLKSRKKAFAVFSISSAILAAIYLNTMGAGADFYYLMAFLLGIACGYWALFATIAAEQFGTNIRATVAITTPNFVRGSVVLMTLAVQNLKEHLGLLTAVQIVGAIVFALAFHSLLRMKETFGKDLNYVEVV